MTSLEGSSLRTKLGLAHMNRTSSDNQMNGSILVLHVQRKCAPTQSNVKAMFIVAYDTDGVILHHTVPQ
jgi:hypothetical protein